MNEPHDTSSGPCSCGAWHDGAPANAPVDPLDTARDQVRALQRELDETRNLLAAERAAHAATRGLADAAVRGQVRAEERVGNIEVALGWVSGNVLTLDDDCICVLDLKSDHCFGTLSHDGTGPSIANALIALHERAGK